MTARVDGIDPLEPPGAEEGVQGHCGGSAPWRTGAAADFPLDHQAAEAPPLCGVVVGRHGRVRNEDEELGQEAFHPSTELPLDGPGGRPAEGAAEGAEPFLKAANPGIGVSHAAGLVIDGPQRRGPVSKAAVLGIELAQGVWMSRSRWTQQRWRSPG